MGFVADIGTFFQHCATVSSSRSQIKPVDFARIFSDEQDVRKAVVLSSLADIRAATLLQLSNNLPKSACPSEQVKEVLDELVKSRFANVQSIEGGLEGDIYTISPAGVSESNRLRALARLAPTKGQIGYKSSSRPSSPSP
jgi:hypothetical protein